MTAEGMTTVALVGGTGPLGRGLATRWAAAGVKVWLGSRDPGRAAESADELAGSLPPAAAPIVGVGNQQAVEQAELVVLAIPYEALEPQLAALPEAGAGRVLVSTAVPMEFRDGLPMAIHPPAGSAAQLVQSICPDARVVAALHTVAAGQLLRLDRRLDEDVLICGDDPDASRQVSALVARIPGLRPVLAGGLATAAACEGITPLLLTLNRLHRARTGIRITGI
jgi:NADPH-dependent F420 reductase